MARDVTDFEDQWLAVLVYDPGSDGGLGQAEQAVEPGNILRMS